MPTNLHLDDNLILKAKRLGKHPTKRAAVAAALEEYVRHRKQLQIIDLFGKIDYYPDYDYRKGRRRQAAKLRKRLS